MRCNRNKLAGIFEKDVKTIDKMVAQGMPYVSRPGDPPGQKEWVFDTVAVIRWMRGDGPDLDEKLRAAKTRILVATAELRTMEYLERVGILHNLDDIAPLFEEAIINIKANLYAIPGRVSQLIAFEPDEDKVMALLQREVEASLLPLIELTAEMKESAAESQKLQDSLARDRVLAKLVRKKR